MTTNETPRGNWQQLAAVARERLDSAQSMLAACRDRLRAAQAAAEAASPGSPLRAVAFGDHHGLTTSPQELAAVTTAIHERSDAKAALRTAEQEELAARKALELVAPIAAADELMSQARSRLSEAQNGAARADAVVAEARATLNRIKDEIAATDSQAAMSRASAAGALLAAAKNGGPMEVTRNEAAEKLLALAPALAMAQQELARAEDAQRQALVPVAAAGRDIRTAAAAIAKGEFLTVLGTYRAALVAYKVAHVRAYRVQPEVPHVHAEADREAQGVLQAEGV